MTSSFSRRAELRIAVFGLIASSLLACGASTSPPPEKPPTDSVVEPRIVRKICNAAPCVGEFARLVVLRDADGEARKIRFEGDLQSCSHPPWIYFDANGVEVLTIPLEPVEPGSPRQQELDAMQASALQGLTEAEVLRCPGV
jgi:hypothetical protein